MERFFNRLDPEVRLKFNHNAGNMVDFVNNPDNLQECVKLGILPRSVLPKDIIPEVPPGEPAPKPAEVPPAN